MISFPDTQPFLELISKLSWMRSYFISKIRLRDQMKMATAVSLIVESLSVFLVLDDSVFLIVHPDT